MAKNLYTSPKENDVRIHRGIISTVTDAPVPNEKRDLGKKKA
jgi:hypothetical protein